MTKPWIDISDLLIPFMICLSIFGVLNTYEGYFKGFLVVFRSRPKMSVHVQKCPFTVLSRWFTVHSRSAISLEHSQFLIFADATYTYQFNAPCLVTDTHGSLKHTWSRWWPSICYLEPSTSKKVWYFDFSIFVAATSEHVKTWIWTVAKIHSIILGNSKDHLSPDPEEQGGTFQRLFQKSETIVTQTGMHGASARVPPISVNKQTYVTSFPPCNIGVCLNCSGSRLNCQ